MATNLPATQETEIKYLIDGREITLSPSLIRKYLVRGHGELATGQEIALLMGICRARGLDPWAGDVYPIKYTANDPMAIITSIDFVRGRARSQPDCEGWDCGIIVQDVKGGIKDTAGLILEGEKLLGGWAECQPKGWAKPVRLEVNLSAYLKKKSDGSITKFWKPEQQPMMISKVGEMQLLRRLWPASFAKLYLQEEMGISDMGISDMGDGPTIDMEPEGNGGGQGNGESGVTKFDALVSALKYDAATTSALSAFVTACAKAKNQTDDEMKATAADYFDDFIKLFGVQLRKKKEREEMEFKAKKAKGKGTAAQSQKQGPFPEDPPDGSETIDPGTGEVLQGQGDMDTDLRPASTWIHCPKEGEGGTMVLGYCKENCVSKMDCQAWR